MPPMPSAMSPPSTALPWWLWLHSLMGICPHPGSPVRRPATFQPKTHPGGPYGAGHSSTFACAQPQLGRARATGWEQDAASATGLACPVPLTCERWPFPPGLPAVGDVVVWGNQRGLKLGRDEGARPLSAPRDAGREGRWARAGSSGQPPTDSTTNPFRHHHSAQQADCHLQSHLLPSKVAWPCPG